MLEGKLFWLQEVAEILKDWNVGDGESKARVQSTMHAYSKFPPCTKNTSTVPRTHVHMRSILYQIVECHYDAPMCDEHLPYLYQVMLLLVALW